MAKEVLIFNPFAGAAGDMILGALIDLGVPLEYLKKELKKVNFSGYEIIESNVTRRSLAAKRIEVKLDKQIQSTTPPSGHPSLKSRGNVHSHSKESYTHDHHIHEGYRTWKEIRLKIKGSRLRISVKTRVLKAFELLAKAEGEAHGVPVEEVHFHEVGATDSLVDMIGTCIAVDYLKPDKIVSTPVSIGSGGFVVCSHGKMPVPVPATLAVLRGIPVRPQPVEMELCTPTGAALLASLSDSFQEMPKDIKIIRTGTGAGAREGAGELPGIFRAILAEEI